jgi:CcmD family protein
LTDYAARPIQSNCPYMDARNFTYMFYGFAAAWIVLVIYVITLISREKKLRGEMERLRRMIEGGGKH